MANLTSNDLKKVGQKYEVNGLVIEVVDYLNASRQRELGLTNRRDGVTVKYRLKVNGEELELSGNAFSNFCDTNGIEVSGRREGGNGGEGKGQRIPFEVRLERLVKEFKDGEELTSKMLDAVLKANNCPEWLKKANEEEAKRIAEAQKAEEAQRRVKETIKNLIAMGYSKAEAEAIATAKTKKSKK